MNTVLFAVSIVSHFWVAEVCLGQLSLLSLQDGK